MQGIGKNREYNFHQCVTSSSPIQANTVWKILANNDCFGI